MPNVLLEARRGQDGQASLGITRRTQPDRRDHVKGPGVPRAGILSLSTVLMVTLAWLRLRIVVGIDRLLLELEFARDGEPNTQAIAIDISEAPHGLLRVSLALDGDGTEPIVKYLRRSTSTNVHDAPPVGSVLDQEFDGISVEVRALADRLTIGIAIPRPATSLRWAA